MNPLGPYSPMIAAVVAVVAIGAAIAVHIYEAVTGHQVDTVFVDNVAILCLGIVLGTSTNGHTAAIATDAKISAVAANTRLDKAGVPAAPAVVAPTGLNPTGAP